ncbi:MAG: hypothetical protein ACRDR6_11390 [Pseudonocardiaceae bacterium]
MQDGDVPAGATGALPVLLYAHGAGGVFVNYSLPPEAKYPTTMDEIYATLE